MRRVISAVSEIIRIVKYPEETENEHWYPDI